MDLSILYSPEIIKTYSKNPNYDDLKAISKQFLEFSLPIIKAVGFIDLAIKYKYSKVGTQVRVAKSVSDELIDASFSPDVTFEDIFWPYRVMELYFDDPRIPTVIIAKLPFDELAATFEKEYGYKQEIKQSSIPGPDPSKDSFVASVSLYTGESFSIHLTKETWNDYLLGTLREKLEGSQQTSTLEDKVGIALTSLAIRVLAYASIPQAIKEKNITRKQMKTGGKPDVKGRPNRPNFIVEYLPKTYFEKTNQLDEVKEHNNTREIKYRKAHIRYLRHSRYVNFPPIKNPDGSFRYQFIYIRPFGDPAFAKRKIVKVIKP